MFSALRQGSLFYILEKSDKLALKIGQVVSVSQPVPRYNTPINMGAPQFGMETVVDITVKTDTDTLEFKQLPANLSIATYQQNGIVISESREAMNAEVESILRNSKQIIESVPYNEEVIKSCDVILRELNPQFAKEKEQEEKINILEKKVSGMDGKLSDILELLQASRAGGNSSNNQKSKL